MSMREYQAALIRAAQISELMNKLMNEDLLDLFETYGNIYEQIVRYEEANRIKNHA